MADHDQTNPPSDQNPGTGDNAQQALDDLTVLQNVQNQNMGDARLNVARSADVSDTQLGNLANVQQGSTGNPQVQNLGGIVGGVNVSLDVAIEGSKDGGVVPPELDSTPVNLTDDGASQTVNTGGAKPLDVQVLPDLAKPDAEFQPQDPALGQSVTFAPPGSFVPGNTPQAGAPPAADGAPKEKAPELQEHVNHTPTVDSTINATSTDHDMVTSGRIVAHDVDGDALSYHISGATAVNGIETIDVSAADGRVYGTLSLNVATGEYTVTPAPALAALGLGEFAHASIAVTVSDGHGGSVAATMGIDVTGTDDNPVVVSTLNATSDDHMGLTIGHVTATDVDTNDSGQLSYSLVDGNGNHVSSLTTDHGTVSIDSATGEYTFTPNAGAASLGEGQSAHDGFTIAVSDAHGGSATAQVGVDITGTNDNPVISAHDLVTGDDHTAVSRFAVGSDADANDSGQLSYSLIDGNGNHVSSLTTDHGTVSIDSATGEYTFTPNAGAASLGEGQSASDAFTVAVADGHGGSATSSVGVTITGSNDAPIVTTHDITSANDHTAISGTATGSDVDTGDKVSYHLVDANGNQVDTLTTDHGSVTIDTQTGEYTFTPDAGAAGLGVGEHVSDSFKVVATDNHGTSSDAATVNVSITGSNDAPVIDLQHTDTSINVTDTTGGQGHVVATDADTGVVDGVTVGAADTLTYSFGTGDDGNPILSVDTPHGTATINPANGDYAFTPNDAAKALPNGSTTTDHFQVIVSDGQGGTVGQAIDVNVKVTGTTNHEPVIDLQASDTAASDHGTISGSISASDIDGDSLSFSLVNAGDDGKLHLDSGTVSIDAGGNYSFTPADGWKGGDHASFQVQVSDGHGGTATQTVTVTETNAGPVIDSRATDAEVSATDHAGAGGSVAATDADTGDTLTYSFGSHADGSPITEITTAHGTVSIDAGSGEYTFTPSTAAASLGAGVTASDSFTVQVGDGHGGSTSQSVTVDLTGTNDGPTVSVRDVTTADDHTAIGGSAVGSDTDVGDKLTYALVDGNGNHVGSLTTDHGTVSIDTATGEYTFTPAGDSALGVGQSLPDSFKVVAIDNNGAVSDPSTVNVTITGSNDGPSVTVHDVTTTDDHTAISGSAAGSDVDTGDTLTYALVDADGNHVSSLTTEHGTVSIDAATGEYTFTPVGDSALAAGETLPDSFQVVSIDNHGAASAASTVHVTIDGANDSATISGTAAGSVSENGGTASGQLNVADVDHGQAHVQASTVETAEGTFTIGTDGQWNFAVNAANADVQGLAEGEHLTKSFEVKSADGTATQTVTVEITGANDGPTISGHTNATATDHGGVTAGHVAASDVDTHDTLTYSFGANADGSPITSVVTDHGTVSIDAATGDYTFTPNAGAASLAEGAKVTDSFTVTVSDGHGGTATTQVGVDITGSNDGPVFGAVSGGTGLESTSAAPTVVTGHLGATDVDGDSLTYAVAADNQGHHGSLSIDQQGNFTFTAADSNWSGTDSFTVQVSDGHGGTATHTVDINVTPQTDGVNLSAANVTVDLSQGQNQTMAGTGGNDTLMGGSGNDNVSGGDGNDTLYGDGQGTYTASLNITDSLKDVDGSESLTSVTIGGVPAGASLSAGTHNADGSWTLSASQLNGLSITTQEGSDVHLTISAGSAEAGGSAVMSSTILDVHFTGNAAGNDVLNGGGGNDTLYGGGGNDTLSGGAGSDLLEGGDGNDVLNYSADSSWASGYGSQNVGDPSHGGTNQIFSITGDNESQDVFRGGAGTDTLVMGSGNDALFLDDGFSASPTGGARIEGIESIVAGDGNDVVDLTSSKYGYGDVTIDGGAGNDVLMGNQGADVIDGGTGNDYLFGASGNDTLRGGDGNDTLDGGFGADSIDGGAGNDTGIIVGGQSAGDVYDGGSGSDVLNVQLSGSQYTAEVRAELQQFQSFIADPAHAGQSFHFNTLGVDAKNWESLKVTVDGRDISLENAPTVTGSTNVATDEDHSGAGAVHATDADVGDSVRYHLVDGAGHQVDSLSTAHGTVTINPATGDYTFTPNADAQHLALGATQTDSFQVVATDGTLASAPTTVGVTITGANDGPSVSVANVTTADDHSAITGHATGADVDTGDRLSYHLVDATGAQVDSLSTAHGTVTINPATGDYTFTPAGDSALGVGQSLGDSFKVVGHRCR
ncbi:MAG: tandem-95 repeat protein [Proteobacteria bacterium]|nr:tandem-95 repeat protein [Pseudomonadota bacterium]